MKTSRRNFITKSMLATAGISAGLGSIIKADGSKLVTGDSAMTLNARGQDAFKISIFSKHLQWLDYNDMAKVAADIGFDGLDLTVRPQGHVLPERVEEDLPRAMEAVMNSGKEIFMITTSINDADDPLSEKILKTASSLGIRHYRMGYAHYNDKKSVEENLAEIKLKLRSLAELNEKYKISGEYQNHSGNYGSGVYFGSPIWDLASVLKDIDSPYLGSQYDIYHATVEGANAWTVGLKLISPFIRSIDIKDFQWAKLNGKWSSETVPLGEGMVDFNKYFELLKKYRVNVPISLHFEYPLGGAEHGARELTINREEVISYMQKDLSMLRKTLNEHDLI